MDYQKAGVDVLAGDSASAAFYRVSKTTWQFRKGHGRVEIPVDDFSGLRYIDVSNLKNTVMGHNLDGIGTKAEIAERLKKFDTLGFDLLAMVCDDAVIRGAEPVAVGNVLDVSRIEAKPMAQLASGLERAAKMANVSIINGEIAELGKKVGGFGAFRLNWAASCIWLAKKDRLLDGLQVKAGQTIITLKEEGFRSNGLSLARKIMEHHSGGQWHEEHKRLAGDMLHPSKIYTRFAVSLFGGLDDKPVTSVSAMAHITGGGIYGKLARALKPSGLGAELTELYPPCKAMKVLMELGHVKKDEAYKTWNMGNGLMIVTDQPDAVLKQAKFLNLDAKVAGTVKTEPGINIEDA
ncbi:hypothetical protein HY994_03535 [Candidatus Micrarchaeota archaeon]|nr:hypothetical protein [Candidatus Micrarchaeota archaeon]